MKKFKFLGLTWDLLPLVIVAWCGVGLYLGGSCFGYMFDDNELGVGVTFSLLLLWAYVNFTLLSNLKIYR